MFSISIRLTIIVLSRWDPSNCSKRLKLIWVIPRINKNCGGSAAERSLEIKQRLVARPTEGLHWLTTSAAVLRGTAEAWRAEHRSHVHRSQVHTRLVLHTISMILIVLTWDWPVHTQPLAKTALALQKQHARPFPNKNLSKLCTWALIRRSSRRVGRDILLRY